MDCGDLSPPPAAKKTLSAVDTPRISPLTPPQISKIRLALKFGETLKTDTLGTF